MSQIFESVLQAEKKHLDQLDHVNNVQYVSWMQDVALAHSETLGVGLADYVRLNHAMVVSEHHVKYRKTCFIHWSVKPRGLARGYKRLA